MPEGPNGERCPADSVGVSVMIEKIVTGTISDNRKSGRVQSGKAGAEACASSLSIDREALDCPKSHKVRDEINNGSY